MGFRPHLLHVGMTGVAWTGLLINLCTHRVVWQGILTWRGLTMPGSLTLVIERSNSARYCRIASLCDVQFAMTKGVDCLPMAKPVSM